MSILRLSGLLFCGSVLSSVSMSAWAQQAAPQNTADTTDKADTADANGEIIVTAQRREERARDVPISMTLISGDMLASRGITNTRDLSQMTPGLRVDRTGAYTQPNMRGITTTFTSAGNDSPVAVYIDGIYQQSLAALTFELPDVKSIEVLKGPQGTLFGRNATGGAIQIFTLDPKYDFGGKFSASYGRFNDLTLNGYVTGPISDKIAVSLSGSLHNNDGYLYDLVRKKSTGGLKSYLFRSKLLFDFTDNFRVIASGFYSKRDDGSIKSQPLNSNTNARFLPGVIIPTRPYDFAGVDSTINVKNYGGSLKMELDSSIGTFTALTGYTKWDMYALSDSDRVEVPGRIGSLSELHFSERAFSQELNLASRKFGAFSFIAGVYYYKGNGRYFPQAIRQDFPTVSNTDLYSAMFTNAMAVYGEATYEFSDRLSLIAGIRFSDERRTLSGQTVAANATPADPLPHLGQRNDSGFTPRVVLKYKANDDINFYASYSQGFKSGTFNSTAIALPLQSVSPEKIKAYEVGTKSRFGPFDINLAGFYYDYSGIQTSAAALINNVIQQRIQNAANARIYGIDLDAGLRVTRQLSMTLGASLLHAKYRNFPGATASLPKPTGDGNVTTTVDASGNYLIRAPKMTINASATYKTPLAGGDFALTGSVYYSSRYYFENANRIVQPSYALVDARASWSPDGTGLTFAVYGNNLTNKLIFTAAFPSAAADGVSYAAPRTWGISGSYRF